MVTAERIARGDRVIRERAGSLHVIDLRKYCSSEKLKRKLEKHNQLGNTSTDYD